MRKEVIDKITTVVRNEWPNSEVKIFIFKNYIQIYCLYM